MPPQNNPQPQVPSADRIRVRRNVRRAGLFGGVAFAVILMIGAYTRFSQANAVKTWTAQEEIPTVEIISPGTGDKSQVMVFPGTLQAFYDANIYARVPGYVRAWYEDIGAHVKKGQLLAIIDTPDLDQQIGQARANLAAAEAAQKLSAVTAQRWESLLKEGAVARQDADTKEEDLESKTASVKAAQANADQLQALKGFARIIAPFDGTVTKRTIDVGALVNAGSPSTPTDPLFAVSDVHILRLYVNVPQNYSAQITPGMSATLTVPEYPGRVFPARMVSTSNAISSQSTLLVEFQADNSQGLLKPGDYAEVHLGLPNQGTMLSLPASALIFRAQGLQVATLGAKNRVVLKPITIGTDLGNKVIVSAGLKSADRVVNNPPDSLASGDMVRIGTDTNAQ
jgi:RND family efflux transporter MFP subunit